MAVVMLAHGEGLAAAMLIAFLAGVGALGCLAGAIMHYFSKDEADKKDARLFLVAAAVCALVIVLSPWIAHIIHAR